MKKGGDFAWSKMLVFFLLLILLTIFVWTIFSHNTNQAKQENTLSTLPASWEDVEVDPTVSGYLYEYRLGTERFYLSADPALNPASLTVATGTLELLYTSAFFNPNACSKMPNAFWKNYILFRDYIIDKETGVNVDVIYAFDTEMKIVSQFKPDLKIIGDIFVSGSYLYFFFQNTDGKIHIAYTETEISNFVTMRVADSFVAEKMQFYAGEPAFTYLRDVQEKYVFDFSSKSFKREDSYRKPQKISTQKSALIFSFTETDYTFIDDKKFLERNQTLQKNGVPLLIYRDDTNIYPIGTFVF